MFFFFINLKKLKRGRADRVLCLVMEIDEDIVIVGAGMAGLMTALGLHRLGIRSLVLESSQCLRVSGFAFTTWTNAWRALDAVGVGDTLRQDHPQLEGNTCTSLVTGLRTSETKFAVEGKDGNHELRCLRRIKFLETLARDLPEGTIRFNAKVVSIDEAANHYKLVHLADGSILKTKVLIGSDGVNSTVSKYLGHRKPSFTGRSTIRGFAIYPDGHSFEPNFLHFLGNGFRSGFLPCNQNTMYWFFTYSPSSNCNDAEPSKLKQLVQQKLCKAPKEVLDVLERSGLDTITSSPLRYRPPLDLLWPGAIFKGNVCVIGDALHCMTPDIGQGGCSAMEDGVILARCLGEVYSAKQTEEKVDEEEEYGRIEKALDKFAKERKWRSFTLVATAVTVGMIQSSSMKVVTFVRDRVLSPYLVGLMLNRADFDCGKLTAP